MTETPARRDPDGRRFRVGFIPLLDAAPLIVAAEMGFAAAENLTLELARETSWANIRDRIFLGHFDAAHMLAPMPISTRLGIGHVQAPLIAPFVLSRGGNAIAITPALHSEGTALGADWGAPGDPHASGRALARVVAARAAKGAEPLTLAAVFPFSCHHYQLCHWISAAGLDPERDVRLVVVPPPHMVEAMATGAADLVCVGAPWVSRAVEAGAGHLLLPSSALWPASPEKVLAVREDFAARKAEALTALMRAIDRAAAWCEAPENRRDLADLLARPDYVGVAAEVIARTLAGDLPVTSAGVTHHVDGFLRFHGDDETGPINRPRVVDGLWFAAQMRLRGQIADRAEAFAAARAVYAPDLWDAAFGRRAGDGPERVPTFAGADFSLATSEDWIG